MKKTAWIVLSAVLFGTVAGTVMTGVQIASSGMVSQFFAIVSSDEKLPEQGEELLPEPFPGGNIPGILPEAPAVPAPATDVSQVVEEAMPAVVAVASTAVYQMPDFGFGWFFGGGSQSYEVPSSGSGIIIGENDTELLIVTNNHVVQDTVSLKITFVDDTAVDAAGNEREDSSCKAGRFRWLKGWSGSDRHWKCPWIWTVCYSRLCKRAEPGNKDFRW